ncbi:hypothetical protein [Pajaroellobacter abortibovis]|uniref:Uncharacterized protein n=1 Tax=Pajaroellobacter abortibovis TaxID=1882918 RepID=A0A1L6MYD1_9BACT|nr:hypothetical protein [Pajaroellobacter abortibovis]APS00496.1 hypothetical protein BCY86_07260 [Pajaroellobacter abortibovis]
MRLFHFPKNLRERWLACFELGIVQASKSTTAVIAWWGACLLFLFFLAAAAFFTSFEKSSSVSPAFLLYVTLALSWGPGLLFIWGATKNGFDLDRSHGLIQLAFSRGVPLWIYLLGRMGGLSLILLMISLSGALLFLILTYTHPIAFYHASWADQFVRCFFYSSLFALTLPPLAFSIGTTSSRLKKLGLFVLLFYLPAWLQLVGLPTLFPSSSLKNATLPFTLIPLYSISTSDEASLLERFQACIMLFSVAGVGLALTKRHLSASTKQG